MMNVDIYLCPIKVRSMKILNRIAKSMCMEEDNLSRDMDIPSHFIRWLEMD